MNEKLSTHPPEAKKPLARLCYVDDSRTAAFVMRRMLEPSGYQVDYFQSAEPAVVALIQGDYDLLLTDLDIPHVFIYRILSHIREVYPRVKIALMYVYCDYTQEMEQHIRRLADVIFLKPFDVEQVKRRIATKRCRKNRNGYFSG